MLLGVSLLLLGAMWLGQDALGIAAMGSPELIGVLGSVEVSVWIDALAGALLAWSATRGMGLARRILPRRRPAHTRRARRTARRRPANDEDGPARHAA